MKSLCVNFGHLSFKSNVKNASAAQDTSGAASGSSNSSSGNVTNDEESFHSADDTDECVTSALASKMRSLTPAGASSGGREDDPAMAQIIDASYIKFEVRLKQLQVLIVDGFSAKVDSASFIKNISALGDDSYLLRPLDVVLHMQQCVYRDDPKLPAWRIFGHLPLIQSTVYDVKLEQTLQLVMSIPTPGANEYKATRRALKAKRFRDLKELEAVGEEGEDDDEEDGDQSESDEEEENYEDEGDEEEDEDELIDNLKSLAISDQASGSGSDDHKKEEQEVQQTISLEFAFEIGEMRFTLQETVVRHFDHITMRVASFGTALQLKTYDSTYHIYLKQIECEYGLLSDVGGAKLYLISSFRPCAESQQQQQASRADEPPPTNLVDVAITQTDLLSPTLGPVHKNILTNVNVRLCLIDFVLNPIAVRNVMLFADEFQRRVTTTTNATAAEKNKQAARKVTKKVVKKIYKFQPNSIYHSDQKVKELIWSQQPGTKTTSKRGQTKGKQLSVTSDAAVDIVEVKCEAKMDGIKVRLCTQTQSYLQFAVSNLTVDSVQRRDEHRIDFELHSVSVRDLDPRAIFTHIVSLNDALDSNLIRVQLVMHSPPEVTAAAAVSDTSQLASNALARQYNKERFYFRNYLNADYFDLVVKANISKLRFVFLNKHLNLLLNMVNVFDMTTTGTTPPPPTPTPPPPSTQQPKSMTTSVTSISAAKEAAEATKERFDFLYRVKLDITLNAPVIFLTPSDELSSSQALFLDCGLIIVKSHLDILGDYWSSAATTASSTAVALPSSITTSIFKKKRLVNDRLIVHRLRIPPVVETQKISLSNMEISK